VRQYAEDPPAGRRGAAGGPELGQWAEKQEISGPYGSPIRQQAVALADVMSPEELEEIRARMAAKAAEDAKRNPVA
jgi:hypothetical protein